MNRRALFIALAGAGLFLLALFGYYLPRHRARIDAGRTAAANLAELQTLEAALRNRPPERTAAAIEARFRDRVPREFNIPLINEELVRISRTTGEITVESITELSNRTRVEDGVRKLPIRLRLRAGYHDFARLLDAIDRSGLPLAVEDFTISKRDNLSPLLRIELTVAACAGDENSADDD